jgi:osmoprotectant transport system permease protein
MSLRKRCLALAIWNEVRCKISTTAIQKMNYQVDNQSQPVERVVSEWLKSQQL